MPTTPNGTEYTVLHSVVKAVKQKSGELGNRKCNLVNVCITNRQKFITIPCFNPNAEKFVAISCFNCSSFAFSDDYYNLQEERLAAALEVRIGSPCARSIAKEIVQSCVFKANQADVEGRGCLDAIATTQLVGVVINPSEKDLNAVEMKKKKVKIVEGDRREKRLSAVEKCFVKFIYKTNINPLCRIKLPKD